MTLKIYVVLTEGLTTSGVPIYTVCWKRKQEETGTVRLCAGTNNFKDDGLPPDVLVEVQKKLNLL